MDIPTILVNYYNHIRREVESSLIKLGKIPNEDELKLLIKKKRVLPIRFCYPESGASKWNQIATDADYVLGNNEVRTLSETISNIEIKLPEKFDIIHIGPGQGIEIPILYDNLKGINNWIGIDISQGMLVNTLLYNREKHNDEFIRTKKFYYLTDVETKGNLSLVIKNYNKKINNNLSKLFLLIGQGVLFSNPETLKNIYNAMTKEDYVYITIEGDNQKKRKEICATYDLPFVRDLLSVGLERAGYNTNEGKFLPSKFNEKTSIVESYFKPTKEEKILCLTSYKPPSKEALEKKLNDIGFKIRYIKNFKDIHTYAVLCQK